MLKQVKQGTKDEDEEVRSRKERGKERMNSPLDELPRDVTAAR